MIRTLLLIGCLAISVCAVSQTRVVLVRHAEKTAESKDPGLTDEGYARAEALVHVLEPFSVSALYSTNYKRTKFTLKPLAEALNLEIQTYPPVDTEAFREMVKQHDGQTIVVSGHSNTVPMLVNALMGENAYAALPEWQYDNLYIVLVEDGKGEVVHLKYGEKSEEK